jgi:hypothetical protein
MGLILVISYFKRMLNLRLKHKSHVQLTNHDFLLKIHQKRESKVTKINFLPVHKSHVQKGFDM